MVFRYFYLEIDNETNEGGAKWERDFLGEYIVLKTL